MALPTLDRTLHPRRGLSAANLPIGALVEKVKEPWRGPLALGLLWASVWGLLLLAFVGLAMVSGGNERGGNLAPIGREARNLPVDDQPGTSSFEEDRVHYVP
ncbi:MAG: hypothetical protein HY725_22740 [Candidatus Rokubacteria bacterium]|nr:hypothetical protein [Candidatus Rokubacteria bacterium]